MNKPFIATVVILFLFVSSIFAQNVSGTFKLAYPELYGNVKIDENTTYDKAKKEDYRNAFYKLKTGADEIRQFEIGVLIEDNMVVFDGKSVRKIEKAGKLDSLKNLIKEHEDKISQLMWGKEKFGADSIRAIEKYVPFKDEYKAKNYDKAYGYWSIMFKEFPIFHSSVYTGGLRIIESKINATEDSLTKTLWIDTLLNIYDQAITFYPQNKGYYLGRKAIDFYDYYLKDADLNTEESKALMAEDYDMLMESIELNGEKSNPKAFFYAMKLTHFQFKLKIITDTNVVVDNYMNFSSTLDAIIKAQDNEKKRKNVETIANIVDQIFFSLEDVSSCEVMIGAFEPQFEATPENPDLLKKILGVLAKKGCTDSDLFEKAAVALYDVEPSPESAARLAGLYITKSDFENAAIYYDKAIETETVDTVKAMYCFEAAKVAKELGQFSKSREYCYQSTSLKPNFGKPYLLVASLYGSSASSCGADAVEVGLVFCLAVDKCIKAKSVDPSIATEANSLIGTYSARYPKFADAFQHNPPINEGQSYTIGCWIGETTTVRVIR